MILCCGEALIDMLPAGPEGKLIEPVTGGAAFNTALALGRLQRKPGFFCGVSTDRFGRLLLEDLNDSGVDHSHCVRSDRPTTLAVIDLTGTDATYTFYDEGSAGRMLSATDLPEIPETVSCILFGGISLIPEPCGTAYETLLTNNAERCVIYLDPNIRANFIDDEETHRARIRRMIAMSDIVKVSDEDLAWVEPDMSESEAVSQILDQGSTIVLLSRGADGAEAHFKGGMVKTPVVKVDVKDTVGAGDTFSAGFLSALEEKGLLETDTLKNVQAADLQNAIEFAARVAAITASRIGANPPWLEELKSD